MLNKEICFVCKKEIKWEGEKYRDINCPNCGVLNSFYNPSDLIETETQEKGENMKPPERKKTDFEKVETGEMLKGIIEEINYDENHKFKGFGDKEDTTGPAVRFKLNLIGYLYPHYSRWMRFNTGAKSNLYNKYLSKLVEECIPDCSFDLDCLKGMKIKVIYSEKNGFQNIDAIYPDGKKIVPPIETIDQTEDHLLDPDGEPVDPNE